MQEPFYLWGEHFAIDLNGARALFTTRRGGFSTGPYASLNLGRLTADDPDAVARNRTQLHEMVGRKLAFARQVHGSRVLSARVTDDEQLPEADGVIAQDATAPMVLTADCLPIALTTRGGVAMLHAGWRGLVAGVIPEGVSAIRSLAGEEPIAAAIGPGAGPCCYEVDERVHRLFAEDQAVARRGDTLDLKAVAALQLSRAGVASVHDIGLCTICGSASLFFSHRRDQGVTGRQAGVVWLS